MYHIALHKEEILHKGYIVKRGDWYQYRRRVPNPVAHLDKRKEIKISLKTKDYNQAFMRSAIYNEQIEQYWKALIQSGKTDNALTQYKATVQLAQSLGFAYRTTHELATASLQELIERVRYPVQNEQEAAAVLGGVQQPKLYLSECITPYFELVVDRLVGKSEHKIIKWQNPRKAAMKHFIAIVGDKAIQEVDRTDILAFKNWWRERIAEGLSADSANKQIRYVKDILRTIVQEQELGIEIEPLFVKTRFQYLSNSRPPFDAAYVQDTLLPGVAHLNKRDRMMLYAMADTGARTTELFGLTPNDIYLDDAIPFIWIRPRVDYQLKTRHSERKIPLVGTALYAFQNFPKGFLNEGNPDTFSNIVNNYMKNHQLRPTQEHSAYSLRHTFKDRLRDIEAPEEIIDSLMGHKKTGPKYGRGHKLETLHGWLQKVAYQVPKT